MTQKRTKTSPIRMNLLSTTMAVMLAIYFLLLLIAAFNFTGDLSATFAALRVVLLAAVTGIGCTYLYLRRPAAKIAAAKPAATSNTGKSEYVGFKKDADMWLASVAEAIRQKQPFNSLSLPGEVDTLKNHSKLNVAFIALLTELENLKMEKQAAVSAAGAKEKLVSTLREDLVERDAQILKSKSELQQALRMVEEQKQMLTQAKLQTAQVQGDLETQKKEAGARIERYRNIVKFLEQAKSTLYSRHGAGKEFLVQLKLGLLADDAINMSNKNDYQSLNYEMFRNGRPFQQLLREQAPVHIDAYPESVKKLRQWIKASGLEQEDWEMFYQNYPVAS